MLLPAKCQQVCLADETILLDLKHLLMEVKQTVPDFLRILESDNQRYEEHGREKSTNFTGQSASCTIIDCNISLIGQTRLAAHTVVDWVIVSPTARNWRLPPAKRQEISVGRTIWRQEELTGRHSPDIILFYSCPIIHHVNNFIIIPHFDDINGK